MFIQKLDLGKQEPGNLVNCLNTQVALNRKRKTNLLIKVSILQNIYLPWTKFCK